MAAASPKRDADLFYGPSVPSLPCSDRPQAAHTGWTHCPTSFAQVTSINHTTRVPAAPSLQEKRHSLITSPLFTQSPVHKRLGSPRALTTMKGLYDRTDQ